MGIRQKRRGKAPQFSAPDIPRKKWCAMRAQYENGEALCDIAKARGCDPRTVRACILRNDDRLDQKTAPKLISAQAPILHALLVSGVYQDTPSIRSLARELQAQLQALTGYTGSEKTIRDYLLDLPNEQLPPACRRDKLIGGSSCSPSSQRPEKSE